MSTWDVILVDQLRYVINDIDSTTWTDAQLEKFLLIAAIYVDSETASYVDNGGPYTIDTLNLTMTPDPTAFSPLYSLLIVLKAACIIAKSDVKKASSLGGWKITDDRSTIDGTAGVKSTADIAKSACDDYVVARDAYLYGQVQVALAVLSPYSNGSIYYPSGGREDCCRWR